MCVNDNCCKVKQNLKKEREHENMGRWWQNSPVSQTDICVRLCDSWGAFSQGFIEWLKVTAPSAARARVKSGLRVDTDGGIHKTCHPWEKKFWAHDSENV